MFSWGNKKIHLIENHNISINKKKYIITFCQSLFFPVLHHPSTFELSFHFKVAFLMKIKNNLHITFI
jgi:hypothetical protein